MQDFNANTHGSPDTRFLCTVSSALADNHRSSVVSSGHSGGWDRCRCGRCYGRRRRGCCCCWGCSRRWSRGWCWKQEVPEGELGPGLDGVYADALQQDPTVRVRQRALCFYCSHKLKTIDERPSYLVAVGLTAARLVIPSDFITV